MDGIVHVGSLVDPDGVAAGVREERQGDGEVQHPRVGVLHAAETPDDRNDEEPADVAERSDLHRLAAEPRRVGVHGGVHRERDDGGLHPSDRGGPAEV